MNGVMYAKEDQIVLCSTNVCGGVLCWHPLFVGKEVMSCSSNSLGSLGRCHLSIAFVVLLMKIKELCSLAADCLTSVQSALKMQKMG